MRPVVPANLRDHNRVVAEPSSRLVRKIYQSFPPDRADDVVRCLSALPDTSQSAERIQTAMVIRARGDFDGFMSEVELVQRDWRDTLMGSGLEHADYETVLDRILGASGSSSCD